MRTNRIGGSEITDLPMYRRARRGIGYLPQESSVFRRLSVEHNILLRFSKCWDIREVSGWNGRGVAERTGSGAYSKKQGLRAYLEGNATSRDHQGVGNDPLFMLLDEPFAGIDPIAVADIQQIIIRLKQRHRGIDHRS